MRRSILSALAVAALVAVPSTAKAQVSFGALAAYHTDAEALGVGAVVKAPMPAIHENVGIMADFTWFFPDVIDYWELNGNLTYDFMLEDNPSLTPFALAGLNIAHASVDVGNGFGDASSTDVGLNLGGGVTFGSSSLKPSVGARIEAGGGDGFVIFGSILLGG